MAFLRINKVDKLVFIVCFCVFFVFVHSNVNHLSNGDVFLTADENSKKERLNEEAILDLIDHTTDNGTLKINDTLIVDNNCVNSDCCVVNSSSICESLKSDCLADCCLKSHSNQSDSISLLDVGQKVSNATEDNVEYINNENSALSENGPENDAKNIFSPYNLFKIIPPFDLHTIRGVSEKCRRQSDIYVKNLKALELWALKMYDSSTKIPSGFLNGNINQYGDIDQCLEVRHTDSSTKDVIKGQYCLASIQLGLRSNASQSTKQIFELVHSHHAFRSKLIDPGHRVPRFSSVTWALCVPSGCSSADVQSALEQAIGVSSLHGDVTAEILMDAEMCQIREDKQFSNGFIAISALFLVFVFLAVAATIGEIFYKESTPEWLMGFSAIKNMRSILSIKAPSSGDDEVKAVHGIRCLNAIMLLIAHKSMAIFFLPFVNRTYMTENLGQPWSVVGRTASLYTDPFIMFSGLLTCYSILGRHNKGQNISIANEYLGRLFRLVPTLGALMLFCTWVLPELSTGPQWPLVVTRHAHICKETWWRNLLFIHNYFGFQNMCLTHTHHIGIDTQLFVLGVPLSLWLAMNPKHLRRNIWILIAVALASTAGRFYITFTMKLANYVSYGASVEQLFKTADHMYIIPAYRITVYIMGMLLAVLLRYPPQQRLSQIQIRLGWTVAGCMFLLSFFLPYPMSIVGYKYNATSAAVYASLAPVGWVSSFAWIIYTQHLGYNTWLGDIFSWRVLAIWTRLSYAIYLTQFPVFFYFVGRTRSPQYFTILGQTVYLEEVLLIGISSILLTLLFDLPFQNLRRIVCRPGGLTMSLINKVSEFINSIQLSRIKKCVDQYSGVVLQRKTDEKMWKKE